MEALHALRRDQELKDKVAKVKGLLSDLILREFVPNLREQRKGFRFIGRIHGKITDWIKYDEISTEQLEEAVRHLHEHLDSRGWTEERLLALKDDDLAALGADVDQIKPPV